MLSEPTNWSTEYLASESDTPEVALRCFICKEETFTKAAAPLKYQIWSRHSFEYWALFDDILSKIEKVPRGIRGEKSSKDMASSRNLVSTIGALASPKMGDGTRLFNS